MEALIDTGVERRKTTKYNLGVILNDHGLSPQTLIYQHIKDLAEAGGLYLVGGTARAVIGDKIISLPPNDKSVSTFLTNIGLDIPNLKDDFEKALEFGRQLGNLDFDVDLIVSKISLSLLMWNLLAHNEKGNVTQVEKNPVRYSITPTIGSGTNFKIDITDATGNARLGKYATTYDSMILPVGQNLDLYGDSIYHNLPPILAMLGDTTYLNTDSDNKVTQAIAVRFLTQSLMIRPGKLGGAIKPLISFGDNNVEAEKTYSGLVRTLSCLIQGQGENTQTYFKFLYTIIPNWDLLSEEIKEMVKQSFIDAAK